MDTPNVRDDEKVSDDHRVLEPTSGNIDDDRVLEPTLENDDDDEILEPTVGCFFKTEQELINYYKQYGRHIGFGIMTQRSRKEVNGTVKYVILRCARGGKARNQITNLSKPRPITKTDCKAKINAHLIGDVLDITTVQNARFFRCNLAIDDSVKRQLDINNKADIGMSKSFNALVVEAGGFEKLPFIERDARNYIDKARHIRLIKGGADALHGYFERMQHKND
ncbi:putative protein FAR1-RELATED SEQUENCE 10 [Juglans microcarpa x Juglans regia]|uniref:putative protein FAR1-RELATED SEQUENCE 10 n=1 Tax=Juglans microcarpa x Juglans regia TaxID=2249226 RepID=UPI001B7E0014|nr:putative protein FAR1-RELATED SEQUENCE 10 [Juglans microcarpa x Juglans regia]